METTVLNRLSSQAVPEEIQGKLDLFFNELKEIGISYIGHGVICDQGNHTGYFSNKKWGELYIQRQYFFSEPILKKYTANETDVISWNTAPPYPQIGRRLPPLRNQRRPGSGNGARRRRLQVSHHRPDPRRTRLSQHDSAHAGQTGSPLAEQDSRRRRAHCHVRGGATRRRRCRGRLLRNHFPRGTTRHRGGSQEGYAGRQVAPDHRLAVSR